MCGRDRPGATEGRIVQVVLVPAAELLGLEAHVGTALSHHEFGLPSNPRLLAATTDDGWTTENVALDVLAGLRGVGQEL